MIDTYIHALTGNSQTPMHWRCIHDTDRAMPAINLYGSLDTHITTLTAYNQQGYGIFVCIQDMIDTRTARAIRVHVIDLDDPATSTANYQAAAQAGANFLVQSSPGKYHVYWRMQPYNDIHTFTVIQRKLNQLYQADTSINDAQRVMRVPGFMHNKGEPQLVQIWALPNYNTLHTVEQLSHQLSHVNVITHITTRHPLGTAEMQAPSLEWLQFALYQLDPNDMDYSEWMTTTAAFKQAGWSHADPDTLYNIWFEWCTQYKANNKAECLKLWNSLNDTEIGWKTFERKTIVKAYTSFGYDKPPVPAVSTTTFGEILSPEECAVYFKDCYFVEREGRIFNPSGRFMNQTQFNGKYGGKQFIISGQGKCTDEPWKAATRSTIWQIPKVDHVRFLPDQPTFSIVTDNLGRSGLNTYIKPIIESEPGDIDPFLRWFEVIFPNPSDRHIILQYMAHCIQFPGKKIPWSILIQSTEGIGKTVFKLIMAHALGDMYTYSPKAPELVKSGSTFNAWMRGKLCILVDEIKIDERRELIEILKPMITDDRIEIQSKGVDQDMEDNPANWIFFSNFKDAIPVNENGRRYAIFYSAMQSAEDLKRAGLDDAFFNALFTWLRGGGLKCLTYYLQHYPIGTMPERAPETSTQQEAINLTRTPLEAVISDAVADGVSGFRGGFISSIATMRQARLKGLRLPAISTVRTCLEKMGYVNLGRAPRVFAQEDAINRTEIYAISSSHDINQFGKTQGYV